MRITHKKHIKREDQIPRIILFSLLLLFLSLGFFKGVEAYSIGTAPGYMYLGEVERGATKKVNFYLITDASSNVLAKLKSDEPLSAIYRENKTGKKRFIPLLASQEKCSDWVSFVQNPVVIPPDKEMKVNIGGTYIIANKKVPFVLKVPKDAEPGYHAFSVKMSPKSYPGGPGGGVSTLGITRPVFAFKVPGEVEQQIEVQDIAATRISKDTVRLDILVRNTGTVTLNIDANQVLVYNKTGYKEKTLSGGITTIPPQGNKVIKVFWRGNSNEEVTQNRVEANLKHITGSVTAQDMVRIPRIITEQPAEEKGFKFPWWIVILVIGLVFLYLYWRWD